MENVFDRIAPGWYNFRHWTIFRKELEELAVRWEKGRLLNIGSAHGPDFLPFRQNFELYGIDASREMLRLGQKYAAKFDFTAELVQADAVHLPFTGAAFDYAISVATYHHIIEADNRIVALKELKRVLKPGGEAFITVWNRWQPRFWFRGKKVIVPWRTKAETLERNYYLFTYPELERMVKKSGLRILKSFPERSYRFPVRYFSRNICLLVKNPD